MSTLRLRKFSRFCAFAPTSYSGFTRLPRSYLGLILLGRRSYATSIESLPRVAQPSLWHSIVPKFLRRSQPSTSSVKSPPSKEWNPATFFIVMFLLIGSNAIQMIALKTNFANFSRRTDTKIALLREVIERVQRGEEVDVEGLLGSGDLETEREWEAVIHEIEEEDQLWQSKGRKSNQKHSSKDDPRDVSIKNPKSLSSPQVGTGTTPRNDDSQPGATKEAGKQSSPGTPSTFY